jgi:WD repeat-containing protein 26
LNGRVLDTYHFGKIKLHDVAVTPEGGERLIGVGPLLESPDGYSPSKSKGEKRLVVYNTKTKQIEKCGIPLSSMCVGTYLDDSQTPVLNDVRDVTLTKNRHGDLVALVSYEHKVGHHFLSFHRLFTSPGTSSTLENGLHPRS